jgi:hypothetical protein
MKLSIKKAPSIGKTVLLGQYIHTFIVHGLLFFVNAPMKSVAFGLSKPACVQGDQIGRIVFGQFFKLQNCPNFLVAFRHGKRSF